MSPLGHRDLITKRGKAVAMLVPPEPARKDILVTIEAMACGTPVIAFPNGAAPELIENERTGFLVASVEEGAERLGQISRIDRAA